MRLHIHRLQSLPTFVLMATSVLAFQQLKIPSDVRGAVVFDLHPASAATQAGLRPGDVVQSINRQQFRNAGEALRLTQNAKEKRTLLQVWSSRGAMEPFRNAARFFGCFNFLTPAENGQAIRYILPFSTLCSGPPRGTGCAYSLIMLKNTENLNTQNGALPLVAAEDFKAEVLESKQPVLVEFWASWSRPCQVFDSVLRELASACASKVKVVKVNADDSLDLSLLYDIQSVPTLLCFVDGNPCLRIVGTATKEAILAKLKPVSE